MVEIFKFVTSGSSHNGFAPYVVGKGTRLKGHLRWNRFQYNLQPRISPCVKILRIFIRNLFLWYPIGCHQISQNIMTTNMHPNPNIQPHGEHKIYVRNLYKNRIQKWNKILKELGMSWELKWKTLCVCFSPVHQPTSCGLQKKWRGKELFGHGLVHETMQLVDFHLL